MQLTNGNAAAANSGVSEVSTVNQYNPNIASPANNQVDMYANSPAELKVLRQWVVWKFEIKPGQAKPTKVPYTPGTTKRADPTDPATWRTFEECVWAVEHEQQADKRGKIDPKPWNGIGFVFSPHDPYAGIDFDHTDDPQVFARQKEWAQHFNSYSERSQSGQGLHVIVKGSVPKGVNSRPHMTEVYSSGRFFAMTGDVYNPAPIEPRQPELAALYAELTAGRTTTAATDAADAPQSLDDQPVIDQLFGFAKGDKYRRLWAGDWQDMYGSQSEADFALIEGLYTVSRNRAQTERMFEASGLYRGSGKAKSYVRNTVAKVAALKATPEGVAASVQRLAAEMAAGAPAHAQDGSPSANPHPNAESSPVNAAAVFAPQAPPEPLSRELPPAPPFPVDALGPILSAAAWAITDIVQCPAAIAAQSVLGAASLAVQGHADVVIPATGGTRPVSLFLLTVADSGERKTSADTLALQSVETYENERFKQHDAELPAYNTRKLAWEIARKQAEKGNKGIDAIERDIAAIGPTPEPPLKPLLTCPEPTYEGLYKLFEAGLPTLGLFSNEGAHFVSGHGMKAENRLAMAAGLCSLWDGTPMKRVRATGEATKLPGRRLAMHLMMQPDVSAKLLSDPDLKDQGLLSRMLVCAPDTLRGTRKQRELDWSSQAALVAFHTHIARILAAPLPLTDGARNELAPRKLHLSPEAAALWRQYADEVEAKVAPNGEYDPISSFASKLPEHALRLAAVIALVNSSTGRLANIPADAFTCGMQLANFYASEALRLWDAAVTPPEIKQAKHLLNWLHERVRATGSDTIDLLTLCKNGPRMTRLKADALSAVRLLAGHKWLLPVEGRSDAWRVRQPQ